MDNRKDSIQKIPFRAKIVQLYENLLKGDKLDDPQNTFWDDFFLLKANGVYLNSELQKLSFKQFCIAKTNLQFLIEKCIITLQDQSIIRVTNSLRTLCTVLNAVIAKRYSKESNVSAECVNILESFQHCVQDVIGICNKLLEGANPDIIKHLCLKLILILVTAHEDINSNWFIESILSTSLFECVFKLLSDTQMRHIFGFDIVLLITLLVNFHKYNNVNAYVIKLSILDDELALNGFSQVITLAFSRVCETFNTDVVDNQQVSWVSLFSTMVGSVLMLDDNEKKVQQMKANNAYLLSFYEAIHLNRNFITILTHTQINSGLSPLSCTEHLTTTTENDTTVKSSDINSQPSNLLVIFLQYCSIVMQDTKTEMGFNTTKLCFLTLCCITEDQYANSLMHDAGLVFKVYLHKLPMRHRKLPMNQNTQIQPLVCSLLDLIAEFLVSHLMKKFPMELYILCVNILKRILCYQKRCRIRIQYGWKNLWSSLLLVLKFIVQNDSSLAKEINIFDLCIKIVDIMNFFIMYGDTFLSTPSSYDELYYELIRVHQLFDDIFSMGMRYFTIESQYKEDALKLNNSLVNIRAIIKHFTPRIEQWLESVQLSTPNEQDILEVVRKNYDSLTLKLQDLLTHCGAYMEKPQHVLFFDFTVKNIISETQKNMSCIVSSLPDDTKNFEA